MEWKDSFGKRFGLTTYMGDMAHKRDEVESYIESLLEKQRAEVVKDILDLEDDFKDGTRKEVVDNFKRLITKYKSK